MIKLRFVHSESKEETWCKLSKALVEHSNLLKTTVDWRDKVKLEEPSPDTPDYHIWEEKLLEAETITLPPEITITRLLDWFKLYKKSLPEYIDIDDFFCVGATIEHDEVCEKYYKIFSTQGFVYEKRSCKDPKVEVLAKCAKRLLLPILVVSDRKTKWRKSAIGHYIDVVNVTKAVPEWVTSLEAPANSIEINGLSLAVINDNKSQYEASDKLRNLIQNGVFLIVDAAYSVANAITRAFFEWQLKGNNCSALYLCREPDMLTIDMFLCLGHQADVKIVRYIEAIKYINGILPGTINNVRISCDLNSFVAEYGNETITTEKRLIEKYIEASIIDDIVQTTIHVHTLRNWHRCSSLIDQLLLLYDPLEIYAPRYMDHIAGNREVSSLGNLYNFYPKSGTFVFVERSVTDFLKRYKPDMNTGEKPFILYHERSYRKSEAICNSLHIQVHKY